MTEAELAAHFARMQAQVSHASLPQLLAEQALHCVDGRNPTCVVSGPGGNAGVFLLMLAALEATMKRPLSASGVDRLFRDYLDRFGHFYMHTDQLSLEALEHTLQTQPGLSALCCPYDAVEDLIFHPSLAQRETLLRLLIQPEHVGCGHLQSMLRHPHEYGVRPVLTRSFFAAFFNALWRGDDRVVYEALESDHRERAVVNVIAKRMDGDMTLPRHCPLFEETQVFLNFPQATDFLLRSHEAFLREKGVLPDTEAETFASMQKQLAERHLLTTLHHLAPGLPVYNVIIDDTGFSTEPVRLADEEFFTSPPLSTTS